MTTAPKSKSDGKRRKMTMAKIGPSSSSSKISRPSALLESTSKISRPSSLLEKMERLKANRNVGVETAHEIYERAKNIQGIPFVMELTLMQIAEAKVPDDDKGNPRQAVNILLTDKQVTTKEIQQLSEYIEENSSIQKGIGLEDVMVRGTIWGVNVEEVEDAFDVGDKLQILNHTNLKLFRKTACFNTQLNQVILL